MHPAGVFEAKVTRIGGNGLACQMKIAVNLLLMVEVICFGEAIVDFYPTDRGVSLAEAGTKVLGFNYDTGERYLSVPDFLPEQSA